MRDKVVAFVAVFLSIYHLASALFGAPTTRVFLPIHLLTALLLCFLLKPSSPSLGSLGKILDGIFLSACIVLLGWSLSHVDTWDLMSIGLGGLDYAMAVIFVLVIAEAARRTIGYALIVLAIIFGIHALWAPYFPGIFFGAGVSLGSLMTTVVISDAGIYGVPVTIVAQYVVLFLVFGALVQASGVGSFFTKLALALFGAQAGGPAKAAVISSGMFGTLSGSGISNVLTTGSFTIPMMKKAGYPASTAGAVEAASAVGGSLMPPIMGAVAFMMAEFVGVPYATVATAALLPAILYFSAIFFAVHLEAKKLGLGGFDRLHLPSAISVLRRDWYMLTPIAVIIGMIASGYSIILTMNWAIGTLILLSWLRRDTAITPLKFIKCAISAGKLVGGIAATCALAGILIACIDATGISFEISQAMLKLTSGNLIPVLLIGGLLALILGTGLTASAVYITMVATVVPLLQDAGVTPLAAHMFAFYFGVISDITPPTALAAVTAASIANANPVRTMMKASALGVGAFFVPFAFIFHPELLMVGDLTEILFAFSSVAMALFLISTGLVGFIGRPLNPVVRAGLILIGAAGIFTTGILCAALITVGLTIVAAVYRWGGRNNPSTKIHNRKSLSPADFQTVFEDSTIKNQAYRMGRIELPEKLFFVLSIFSCGVLYFTNIQNSMWGIWAIFICMLALASLAYIRHYPKEQAPLYSDDQ
mgnify:CR=1 FL=1